MRRDGGAGQCTSATVARAAGARSLRAVGIDAEALLDGLGEEGFGVDGAGEVHVEVGALGEGLEEGVELGGPRLWPRFEGAGGAGFAGGGVRVRRGRLVLSDGVQAQRGESEGESDASADHDPVPFECFEVVQGYRRRAPGRRSLRAWVWSLGGRDCYTVGRRSRRLPSTDEAVIPSPTGRRSRNARTRRAHLAPARRDRTCQGQIAQW